MLTVDELFSRKYCCEIVNQVNPQVCDQTKNFAPIGIKGATI